MFISYYVCLKCRGRVVTNVVRTCDPTPLLYIFGNKNMFKLAKVTDFLLTDNSDSSKTMRICKLI